MKRTIGILALQGDFEKHQSILNGAGIKTLQVKKPDHLKPCDGLIIPGGESTTLIKLMKIFNLFDPIREFASKYPVMGTCAGVIVLSSCVDDNKVIPLNLIDITVSRNAYGRQVDSFAVNIDAEFLKNIPMGTNNSNRIVLSNKIELLSNTNRSNCFEFGNYKSIFIRAPKILNTGKKVKILMEYKNEPVMVQQDSILGLTFHPELTDDFRIHNYFLSL